MLINMCHVGAPSHFKPWTHDKQSLKALSLALSLNYHVKLGKKISTHNTT